MDTIDSSDQCDQTFNDSINLTINQVLSQFILSEEVKHLEKNKEELSKKKSKKRANSLDIVKEDKKTKFNVNCQDFIETSRLFSRIFERLDFNRLEGGYSVL